ncbi:MAG TPA: alpha-L-fucosidase [Verrucomicrobiae bacterium]|nr:alpha-L-fucosidase [Verrucomicrobiae bacterium]
MNPLFSYLQAPFRYFILWGLAATAIAHGADMREQNDARMEWWREAKFGLFIHWGVYAVPAGTYQDKPVAGIGEWIMLRGRIPVAEYRAYATQFNPVKYNPRAWAKLAREAGMKYIVITAKHHDGFALFPSDVTDWDIADATPYGKDLLGPLAAAARRQGLKFGTYYSQAQDWTHPGGAKSGHREGGGWDEAHKGNFDEYLEKIAVPQTREILTRIKPDILWWDTPDWMTTNRAKRLHELTALRPGLITNNRLGGGYRGDTETPEQHVPATGFKDRDWETCMTMNDTWGYKSYDHNWKSTETLLRNLVDIVSKGGNYLLNVGPTADGQIPAPSIQRLKEIGAWMKVNGSSIHGTTANPFAKLSWGRCTKKVTSKGGTLYLHVFHWPNDGRLVVPGLKSKVTQARVLATRQKIKASVEGDSVVLSLPTTAPDAVASVIEVNFAGPLEIERILPAPAADGRIVLGADISDLHNSMHANAKVEGSGADAKITHWDNPQSRVTWEFRATQAGTFNIQADIIGSGSGKLVLLLDTSHAVATVPEESSKAARTIDLGSISIARPGDYTLELKPDKSEWKGFELRRITLIPAQ